MDGMTRQQTQSARRWAATVVALAFLNSAMMVEAHDAPRKDLGKLSEEAELIFEGVVVKIDYAMSDPGPQPGEIPLPHTYVTYQISDAQKGRSNEGGTITLRFLGGPTPDGRVLDVSNAPSFEQGQRDLLFVKRNGESNCPLVGCNKGRFRVVDEQIFTDDGVEVLLTPDGQVSYGRRALRPELLRKRLGNQMMERKKGAEPPDADEVGKAQYKAAEQQLRIVGERANVQRFKLRVGEVVKQRVPLQQLQAMPAARSVKPAERFVARMRPPKGPAAPRLQAIAPGAMGEPSTPEDQKELELLQKAQGNPVLGAVPPAQPTGPLVPGRIVPRGDGTLPEGGSPPGPETPPTQ